MNIDIETRPCGLCNSFRSVMAHFAAFPEPPEMICCAKAGQYVVAETLQFVVNGETCFTGEGK